MSKTPENIELQDLKQGNVSDASSEVSEITSSVAGEFERGESEEGESEEGEIEEELPDQKEWEHHECEESDKESSCISSNSGTPSVSGEAVENSSIPDKKSEVTAHEGEASNQEHSGSEKSSDEPSDEGEPIARIPTNNNGKQGATGSPRSILKKDTGKERAVIPFSENNKHTSKRCTRCNRPVFKIRRRRLPSPVNSTAEEATDTNTIYNLEGYHTSNPVTILCGKCCAVGKAVDRYKKTTVFGRQFVKGSSESRKAWRKYRVVVIEREKSLVRFDNRNIARSSRKSAVSFVQGASDWAGVRSGATSVASTVSTVSFGPLPEPVDGVGAIQHRRSFCRGDRKHYKSGRWSWEAMRERGDLKEYDYDENAGSPSDNDESSLTSSVAENSVMGAARGAVQEPEGLEETEGWLDTSGMTIKYEDYYTGINKPAGNKHNASTNHTTNSYHVFNPESRTVRRRNEPTVGGYLKELSKFWCCL